MPQPSGAHPATQLFDRMQAGDASAPGELLAALAPELQLYIRCNFPALPGTESVADVAQSVVGDLLPEIGRQQFADLGGLRAWVRRSAHNKVADLARYHAAKKRSSDRRDEVSLSTADQLGLVECLRSLPSPSQAAMANEEAEQLEQALLRLPEDQRRVVTMARLLGMPHREIAEALGRSEVACRMLLRRGLVNLARELDRTRQADDGVF